MDLSSQNCIFKFGLPDKTEKLPPEILSSWLIALNFDSELEVKKLSDLNGNDLAMYWLNFSLELNLYLYESLGLPFFKKPIINYCVNDENNSLQWRASVNFPSVEAIGRQNVFEILKMAFSLSKWIGLNHAPTAENCNYVFNVINNALNKFRIEFKGVSKSTYEVLRTVHRLKIPYKTLHAGAYQLGWGVNSRVIDRSSTEKDSAMGMRWSHNKFWSASILRDAGLPVAQHHLVHSIDEAKSSALEMGFPVVIKPVDLDRGEGITVDVLEDSLKQAFELAYKLSPSKKALVEQQVPGICHRIFIAQGRLLYAVKRLPIGVYGNGQSTIAELISTETEKQAIIPPWKRSKVLGLDALALHTLKQQNLGPDSIPDIGYFVALRRIETSAWGGVDEEVTKGLHPDNLRIALVAAKTFNLDVAGIDIISTDISQPWYENGAIINEVNYAPLLGGGEISRSYLDQYVSQLIPHQGRIPIVVFVGGIAAMQAAQDFLQTKNSSGYEMLLTSGDLTFNVKGQELHMPLKGLNARVNALLMQKTTHALIIVVQTNEILLSPFHVDKIDELHEIDKNIFDKNKKESFISEKEINDLYGILRSLLTHEKT